MKERELTCIVCPLGCQMTVTMDDEGKVVKIVGNTCPRGAVYAETECTNPMRTVTSTVLDENNNPVPVKTSTTIPKGKIFECMKILNQMRVSADVQIGDVVAKDVFGADIVVTGKTR